MRTVWQRLLDRLAADEVTICADEVPRWENQWHDALGLGLLRETELATAIACDQCGDSHWAEIYWVTPGVKACFGCETEGVIDIEIDRLRQWRIDADRVAGLVAGLVAGALELPAPIEMLRHERFWRLGRRRLGGRYRDIFLGVSAGLPVAEMSAAIRSSIGPGAALLLTLGTIGNPEGLPAAQHLLDLASVSRLEAGRLVIDLDYVEERLAGEEPFTRNSSPSIPVPGGATWRDISIIVFDGLLQVLVRGKVYEKDFAELGVGQQSQPIALLKLFAAARGTLDTTRIQELVSGNSPVKTRVLRLRQFLQKLVAVDGSPVEHHKKANLYTCQFEIRLAGDEGFRARLGLPGSTLRFMSGRMAASSCPCRSGRSIRPTFPNAETGAPSVKSPRVGPQLPEPIRWRRSGSAQPLTEEGTAFIELLRAGGNLPHRSNDVIVLTLAKRLRDWTGLDGDPLQLVEASRSWTSAFACSSEIKAPK